MRSMLIIVVVAAGLAFLPYAAPVGAQETSSGRPPVGQPLVSEGQFAVKLANGLGLTSSQHEAAAEDSLSRVNIAPRNGWISDYPMTPDIIEEVRQSAARAALAGGLNMSEDNAARAVSDVSSAMNLPVGFRDQYSQQASSSSSYSSSSEYASSSSYGADSQAPPPDGGAYGPDDQYAGSPDVDSYYTDYGPPVVTYYAPPGAYDYLYDWVPYPFWWGGFYFGGFYVLNDFDCHGGCHRHHGHDGHDGHGGHGGGWEGHRITNHVGGANGAVARIDPVNRATGRTRSATFSGGAGTAGTARFNSARGQAGARTIYERSAARNPVAATQNLSGYGGRPAGTAGGAYRGGAYSGARGFSGTPSRSGYSGGRNFGAPSAGAGSFAGRVSNGASSPRSFGGGGFGGQSAGFSHSFGGAGFGGHGGSFGGGGFGGGFGGHGGGFGGGGFGGHGGGGHR
jgi:hypothetical protein